MTNTLAVIGAGIIGLTSAISLQDAGYAVTIFTKQLPQDTTSSAAGAIWWGYGTGKIREWAEQSLKICMELIEDAQSGVRLVRLRDVYRHRIETPWFQSELPYCERIPADELTAPYVDGFLMDVPLMESPRLLAYLEKRFRDNGGELIQRTIDSFSDLADDYPIIVNCTGLGARELAGDDSVHPIRGQILIIDAPDIEKAFMDDEVFTYIFPRSDGVLLGGSKHYNDNLTVDDAVRDDIVARCGAVDGRVMNRPVVTEKVGLRPGRDVVRLESERLSDDCMVIHNYGHGPIGFTLSWGCARDVVRRVQPLL